MAETDPDPRLELQRSRLGIFKHLSHLLNVLNCTWIFPILGMNFADLAPGPPGLTPWRHRSSTEDLR